MNWALTNPGLLYGDPSDPTSTPKPKYFKNNAERAMALAAAGNAAVQPQSAQVGGQLGPTAADDNGPTSFAGPTLSKAMPTPFHPSFNQANTDPTTGAPAPSFGNPATSKLGKLLSFLGALGTGAAIGSQYRNFGQGFQAAGAAQQQQQQEGIQAQQQQLGLQQQRAQVAALPWMLGQARQKAAEDSAHTVAQTALYKAQADKAATDPGDQHLSSYTNDAGQFVEVMKKPNGDVYEKPLGAVRAATDEAHNTVETAAGIMQYNPATKHYDIPVGKAPPRAAAEKKSIDEQAIEAAAQSLAFAKPGDLTRLRDLARSDKRLLIYNRAKQLNPNFNTAAVDRQIEMENDRYNGKLSQNLQSFGTFLEHAGEASNVTNEYRNTSVKMVNTAINKLADQFGSEAYSRFTAALEPVRKEFEGFLLGGRALYGDDRKQAEIILSDNSSPAQIQAALKQMGHTVKARYNEANYRYKQTMGQDIEGGVSPEAAAGAKQIGLDMGTQSAAGPSAAAPKIISMANIQRAAREHKVSVDEAKRQAQAQGYTIQ